MKRCPHCNDFALYDDNIVKCPICDTDLVTYVRNSGSSESFTTNRNTEPIRPNNDRTNTNSDSQARQAPPEFERTEGFRYYYRGIITEINSHARLHSKLKKWVNAVFRGEPYQFGNTSHETVLRIEEFHNGRVSGRRRDLIYYGDVEGRFNYGDDVNITAKRRGDRYIVTRMYLNETDSKVKPGPQIPASMVVIFTLLLLVAAIYVVGGVVSFLASGALLVLFQKSITTIIVIVALLFIFRKLFKR